VIYLGSAFELNDTLQLTSAQGFPKELDLEKHFQTPFSEKDFSDRVFEFRDKPGVRNFQQFPVRVFLVENRGGKWVYWGLAHVIEVTQDYVKKTTSGKYKIIRVYSPEEMKTAFALIDGENEKDYFRQ